MIFSFLASFIRVDAKNDNNKNNILRPTHVLIRVLELERAHDKEWDRNEAKQKYKKNSHIDRDEENKRNDEFIVRFYTFAHT